MGIMLIRRDPKSVIELMFFVVARKMLIKAHDPFDILFGVASLAGLFAIRKYLEYVSYDFRRFQIEAAQALSTRAGLIARLPWIHDARARLAHALGDDATYDRELRQALELFTDQGATGHAARVTAELGDAPRSS